MHSLLAIAYDPVAYYRPWRNSVVGLSQERRALLNAHLIDRFELPPLPADAKAHCGSTLTRRILENWALLPATAYLMACAKHRAQLMVRSDLMKLPAPVHAVLRERHLAATGTSVDAGREDSLLAWGGGYLCLLGAHMQPWIAKRMPLLFFGTSPAEQLRVREQSFDFSCFWSALNHAAYYSRVGSTICH